jgi:hypothetical protein
MSSDPLPVGSPDWLRAVALLPCAVCSAKGPHRTLVIELGGGLAYCEVCRQPEVGKNAPEDRVDSLHRSAPLTRTP